VKQRGIVLQTPSARCNVELKARYDDLDRARRIAETLGGEPRRILQQRDTYFHAPQGRLKLRETAGEPAVLIAYDRPDHSASRTSHYHLVAVPDARQLSAALQSTLGVRCVVEKRRELFLYRNVRIHLDEVTGLGTFLEFEAVLGPDDSESGAHSILANLCASFGISDDVLLAGSYADLLA
jgi:adenylate cyclase class 2